MAKISKHGKREKGDANAKHQERRKSKEERCKPKVKIKSTKASDVLKQTAEQDVAASKSLLPEVKMAKEAVLHSCEAAELLLSEKMAKDAELQMCVKDEELATTSPNVIALSGSESEIFLNLSKGEYKKYLKILSDISEIFLNLSKREYFTKFLKKLVSGISLEKGNSKKGATARWLSARVFQLAMRNGAGDQSDRSITTAVTETGEEGKTAQATINEEQVPSLMATSSGVSGVGSRAAAVPAAAEQVSPLKAISSGVSGVGFAAVLAVAEQSPSLKAIRCEVSGIGASEAAYYESEAAARGGRNAGRTWRLLRRLV
jgi:membrane-bound inhibitor of C-type lysozyme